MDWVEQDGKYGIYNIDGTVIQPWDIEKAYVMNENSGTTYLTFERNDNLVIAVYHTFLSVIGSTHRSIF